MSQVLEPGSFDIVFSCSVFEHLVMPWKVAVEMNRVMRIGAIGLIVTHQTVGMHDLPWDYFRFSDSAWTRLFNSHTGFEILGTELGDIQYIIPHVYQNRYFDVEKTRGFEYSAVLVETAATERAALDAGDVTSACIRNSFSRNCVTRHLQYSPPRGRPAASARRGTA